MGETGFGNLEPATSSHHMAPNPANPIMRTRYKASNFEGSLLTNSALGFAFTALVFFLLPLMHILGQLNMNTRTVVVSEGGETPPPPPPEEPLPPPESKQELEKPDVAEPPPPLTLNQLELALNPGSGNATSDFSFGDFEQEEIDIIADMEIFNIDDLDEIPRLIFTPSWTWPKYALAQIKSNVRAKALIFIDPDGSVKLRRLQGLTQQSLEKDITKWVEQVRFTSPKRNGKSVRAQYLFPLEFAKP